MQESTLIKLDLLCEKLGVPVLLSSAYRCLRHNTNVGGAKHSAHMEGYAVDIPCHGVKAYNILEAAFAVRFTGIEVQQMSMLAIHKRWIHLDDAPATLVRQRPYLF